MAPRGFDLGVDEVPQRAGDPDERRQTVDRPVHGLRPRLRQRNVQGLSPRCAWPNVINLFLSVNYGFS